MAKRVCLLTGNETNCTDSCYRCGCGGEVALNDFYVPIYNVQRVCDIVKGFECTSIEGEEIAEYIRNELEKMTVCIENKATDVQPVIHAHWRRGEEKGFRTYNPLWYCSNCGGQIRYDTRMRQYQKAKRPVWEVNAFCRKCGARMDGEDNE